MKDRSGDFGPPISVIVCTCDRADSIGRAIQSVLEQRYPNFEVITVDQSRDTRTEAIVRHLERGDSRVRYVRLEERGLSRAYNWGVKHARHDLLAFTDDDCVAPPTWLADIARTFAEEANVRLLYGQVLGPPEPEARREDGVIPTLPIHRFERLSRKDGFKVFGMAANFAARRSAVLRLGGFDEVLGGGGPLESAQDFDFAYRLYRDGGVIALDPRVVVHHYGFRSHADWPATVGSYGVGVGGFYFKHVRAGDPYATMMLLKVFMRGGLRMIKRVVLAQPTKIYRSYLRHIAVGIWRSRAYPVDRRRRLYGHPVNHWLNCP